MAGVLLQHEIDEMNISIIVNDKRGNEIFREKMISELPDEWYYASHLGKINWVSDNEIVLVNKKGDKEWRVNM